MSFEFHDGTSLVFYLERWVYSPSDGEIVYLAKETQEMLQAAAK